MQIIFIGRPYCAPRRGRQRTLIAAADNADSGAALGLFKVEPNTAMVMEPPGPAHPDRWLAALPINAPSVDKHAGDVFYHEDRAGELDGLAMGDHPVPMRLLNHASGLWAGLAADSFKGGWELVERVLGRAD